MTNTRRPATAAPAPAEAFTRSRRGWDEWIGQARRRERTAYGIAAGALLVAGMAVWDNTGARRDARSAPIIIEVDPAGYVVRSSVQGAPRTLTDAQVARRLEQWVSDVRTVHSAAAGLVEATQRAYSRLRSPSPARATVLAYHRSAPPHERAAEVLVTVRNAVALRQAEGVWQVEWREITTARGDNRGIADETWRMIVTVAVEQSTAPADIAANPDNFWLIDLDWRRVDATQAQTPSPHTTGAPR